MVFRTSPWFCHIHGTCTCVFDISRFKLISNTCIISNILINSFPGNSSINIWFFFLFMICEAWSYREWFDGPNDCIHVRSIFAAADCCFELGWVCICRNWNDDLNIVGSGSPLELTLGLSDEKYKSLIPWDIKYFTVFLGN